MTTHRVYRLDEGEAFPVLVTELTYRDDLTKEEVQERVDKRWPEATHVRTGSEHMPWDDLDDDPPELQSCPACRGTGSLGGVRQQVSGEQATAIYEGEGCYWCNGIGECDAKTANDYHEDEQRRWLASEGIV